MPCRWYPSMPCRSLEGLQAHTQGRVSPGRHLGEGSRPTPGGVSRPTPRRGVYPSMHWGRPPTPVVGYCRGRYASYCNAFLFLHCLHTHWGVHVHTHRHAHTLYLVSPLPPRTLMDTSSRCTSPPVVTSLSSRAPNLDGSTNQTL